MSRRDSYHGILLSCFDVCKLIDTDFVSFLQKASAIDWTVEGCSMYQTCLFAALHMVEQIDITWVNCSVYINGYDRQFSCCDLLDLIMCVSKFGHVNTNVAIHKRYDDNWKRSGRTPTDLDVSVNVNLNRLTRGLSDGLQLYRFDEAEQNLIKMTMDYLYMVLTGE